MDRLVYKITLGILILLIVIISCAADEEISSGISADFSGNITTGYAPLAVYFTDMSSGSIESRVWSFGDQETSNDVDPIHIYSVPGKYSVTLTVTGLSGTDKKTRIEYIKVESPVNKSEISENMENLSLEQTENENVIIQNGEMIYEDNYYNSSMQSDLLPEVTENSDEIQESSGETNLETTQDLKADFFTAETEGLLPYKVTFNDNSTGPIRTWSWDFGDGTSSAARSPVHIYQRPGTFNITLTVSSGSSTVTITKPELVRVLEPVSAGFISENTEGTSPFTVEFIDQSKGEIINRIWSFGDGQVSSDINPVHEYLEPGTYDVKLTVYGSYNEDLISRPSFVIVQKAHQAGSDFPTPTPTDTILLTPIPTEIILPTVIPTPIDELPSAGFNINNNNGTVPMPVEFTDTSTGNIDKWNWDFGDGSTSNSQNPEHLYNNAGIYTVNLTVEGSGGKDTKSISDAITVNMPSEPIKAGFSADPISGDAPLEVSFKDASTGNISSWRWTLGYDESSDLKDPVHIYNTPGNYSVTLKVAGDNGEDYLENEEFISVYDPVITHDISIIATPANGSVPLNVSFRRETDLKGLIYSWDFGDGNISTTENPVHQYSNIGMYNVNLTIKGESGYNRTIFLEKPVIAERPSIPPIADFTQNNTNGGAPVSIKFSDISTGDITGWSWNFGDGISSNEQNPVHNYTVPGKYSVSLFVSGPGGNHTVKKEDLILIGTILPKPDKIPESTSTNIPAPEVTPTLVTPIPTPTVTPTPEITPAVSTPVPTPTVTATPEITPAVLTVIPTPTVTPTPKITPTVSTPVPTPTVTPTPEITPAVSTPIPTPTNIPTATETAVATITSTALPKVTVSPIETQNGTSNSIIPGNNITPVQKINQSNIEIKNKDGEHIVNLEILASQLNGTAPLNVSFNSTWSDRDINFLWYFGDGTVDSDKSPEHIYRYPGLYSVQLICADEKGRYEVIRNDMIDVSDPVTIPMAGFDAYNTIGQAPLNVFFTGNSNGTVDSWNWNYGDGESGSGYTSNHTYDKPGVYSVSLLIKGPKGSSIERKENFIVVSSPEELLVAGFNVSSVSGKEPLTIWCKNNSKGKISRILWEFGDGAVSEDKNPSHRYTKEGKYIIRLTVYGPGGSSSADQKITVGDVPLEKTSGFSEVTLVSNISNPNLVTYPEFQTPLRFAESERPVADFYITKKSGKIPLKITCIDRSTGYIETWEWNFGDGFTSNERNPVHVYTTAGTYSVTLTISGPGGISTKKIKDGVIVI